MKKIIFLVIGAMMGVMMMGGVVGAAGTFGEGDGCGTELILGMRPWFMNLEQDGNCNVKTPSGDGLSLFIWGIVTNILYDLFVIIGYLAIGFIIFGGYTYLLAKGDPGKVEKGKKTLVAAVTGLVIAMLASLIVAFISDNIIKGGA